MTTSSAPLRDRIWLGAVLLCALQWVAIRAAHVTLPSPWDAALPGLGIFGAAFALSWGAELAQLEISESLAIAFLALMAVLPEYAVDVYLAWTAAKDPSYAAFAAANMTGANRILIGIGWPIVLLCYWAKTRRREITVERGERLELATLTVATLYAFVIPLKRTLSLFDTVFLVTLFVVYLAKSGQAHHEEPELAGPPRHLARLPRSVRRMATIALFLVPGLTIFLAAQPFAEALLRNARHLGVEEFVLIQWLAPLASESPEFIVATLFALRRNARAGLGTLISSKVNQWTLLIGMLPLAYAISAGHVQPMHLDGRQAEEIFLTAAQSALAVVMLANLKFGLGEGLLLLGLFSLQLLVPQTQIRLACAGLYVLLALGMLSRRSCRRSVADLLTRGWRGTPS